MPLVSVAMASYNGAKYIEEQLRTIREQTWPNLEVVVSDDGSTDGTIEILAAHQRARHLRYTVNERRLGLVGNFERAIAGCRGEFICLADQDDLWNANKVEVLVREIGRAALAYGRVDQVLGLDGGVREIPSAHRVSRFARAHGSGRATKYLLAENWIVSHSLMIRRSTALSALPVPAAFPFHDHWLALVAATSGGLQWVDATLQVYREHSESLTFAGRWHPSARRRWDPRSFAKSWEIRSRFASSILEACRARLCLLPEEARFLDRLERYYAVGGSGGAAGLAFLAGLGLMGVFVTARSPSERLRIPLKPVVTAFCRSRVSD